MGWAIGTLTTGTPLLKDVNDYVVNWEQWEEPRNTPLGSPTPLLHQPAPAAWGTLDDEAFSSAFIDPSLFPQGTFVAGGRRFSAEVLKKKWDFQLQLTYEQGSQTPGLFTTTDRWLAKDSQELLPVLMRHTARWNSYRAATVQEGLNSHATRPGWIPAGIYSDTKCRVMSEIQRHFLEPVIDGGISWQLWSQEEVHKVLEYRVHRFLLETGLLRKEANVSVAASQTDIEIPQDSIEVRRVDFEYADLSKKPRALFRIDTQQADSGQVGWDDSTGEPHSYIEDPRIDTMTLRTCPAPDETGNLRIRYVPMPAFDIEILCEPLPIPRMFTWAIKWGVIADLLKKEGQAHDPVRSEKAELMYRLGVDIAKHLLGAKA